MWYFGIRGKVALLVVFATAASAFLIAKMLSTRAEQVLREHELVDLGDEASLRAWEISGQVQGLRDDVFDLIVDEPFQKLVAESAPEEALLERARLTCRRYWSEHIRIDLVRFREGERQSTTISEKASIAEDDLWFPPPDGTAGAGLHLSGIQRILVTRPEEPGIGELARWEPVIWAVAPLDLSRHATGVETRPTYLRVLMTLYDPPSPRHFFAMENEQGKQLVRHDEIEPVERDNDKVFLALADRREIREALAMSTVPSGITSAPKERVDRLVITQNLRLASPYHFQEGLPGPRLSAAMDSQPIEEFVDFYDRLVTACSADGRIGGLRQGVLEVRLLAQTPEKLSILRDKVVTALIDEYGDAYDGVRWRQEVECDEIHAWAVRLLIGDGPEQRRYLIHYAVMDDELASSIAHEMDHLRSVAAIAAGGFGVVGFVMAMWFIRPLRRMTSTAQQITESEPERFYENLRELARGLDIKRRDEVGDIARSGKRLFEELIQFHEKLEQRVHDRTRELRRANAELEKANDKLKSLSNEKDAFVAKISHDLRQPLNAIFLQVEALKLSDLDEIQKDDVERIHQHAERELRLVNDILEYQKIIMGAESLHRDTIDVGRALDDLATVHGPVARARGVGFSTACPPDTGQLVADERRLRQILGNLVSNACKFTRDGAVTVEAKPLDVDGDAWVEFTVGDTGRGMSPEEQAKAFEPFVSNKQDNAGGTGLGLPICRELVQQMGGRIGFVSELGKGTRFSVSFPREPVAARYFPERDEIAASPETPAEADAGPAQTPGFPSGRTTGNVLVVDDDPAVRSMLARLLEKEGYTVTTVSSGECALETARRDAPDIITLDIVMPGGMDGWQVLQSLKGDPSTEHIPVIMITVQEEDDEKLALDAEDYLVKPVDVERLRRVVARVTRQSPQRNLLLVDDDEQTLHGLQRILGQAGWETILAANGKEALAALDLTRPAAIVLDLMMPEMDGFQFLRRLRESESLRTIPVVVMSGKEPSEEERDFLRDHDTTVLAKGPGARSALLEAIRRMIRGSA